MKKSIVMLSHYNPPGRGRYYYWGKHLISHGHKVYIVCSSFLHGLGTDVLAKEERYRFEEDESGITYVYVKTSPYIGNGVSRIRNMIDYYFAVDAVMDKIHDIDLIVARGPNHLACVAGIQYGKKHKIPVINDIVDLWPESIVTYMHMSKNNPVIWALYQGERWIYKNSTAVIHSMPGFRGYLKERRWDKLVPAERTHYINIGVNVADFDMYAGTRMYDDPVLTDNIIFKVAYTGSVRLVNGLKVLVDAGKIIQDRGIKDIFVMIHGAGDQVDELTKYCQDNGIRNVKLYGRVQKDDIPYILTHSDLCVLCYQSTPLLRFGGSMNKMFEYFASGKPVIANAKMGYSIIDEYQCGTELGTNDPEKLADEIIRIYRMPKEEREQLGRNARKAAEAYDVNRLNEQLDVAIDYAMNHNFY